MPSITVTGLRKRYGRRRGVDDISLAVASGEIFGFLGPNGAGKTTTIRVLLGFLRPDGGSGCVLGRDIVRDSVAVRRHCGYLATDAHLYPYMTGQQAVDFALGVRGQRSGDRVRHLRDTLDVDLSRPIKHCSRGMRQKVALICALAADPEVLVLDEPTTGLDPLARRALADLLRQEADRGKAVLFSSHDLAEVENLCTRAAIVREGRVVVSDQVEAIRRSRHKVVSARFAGQPPDLADVAGVRSATVDSGALRLEVVGDLRPLLTRLAAADLVDLRVEDPSLEDAFFAVYAAADSGAS